MFSVIANMFKIPELRRKIFFTFAFLAIYRLAAWIMIPGVDYQAVQYMKERSADWWDFLSVVTGGTLQQCSLTALGIMPYISSSIIFQLLVKVVPSLEALAKEGESGRRKIHQYERYFTVLLCMIQGWFIVRMLMGMRFPTPGGGEIPLIETQNPALTQLFMVMVLTTGTIFLMWLGEQITEFGVGNGISIIIMAGIISRMPSAFAQFLGNITGAYSRGEPVPPEVGKVLAFIGLFVGIVVCVVMITQGQRKIPIQQQKVARGRRIYGGQRHFLPLRVNAAGVLPIIFAQSIIILPAALLGGLGLRGVADMFQIGTFWYTVVYLAMIGFFTYFWTALTFNPVEIANNLKEHGSFIPGYRPGNQTALHIENILNRITLVGSAFLSFIAIFPQMVAYFFNINQYLSGFLGGTGILIVVGVALDMVQKVEGHLLMRHYEGFMKKTQRGSRTY
ncbi:MAG: preprotein translocase subunit SecY [Planctomycetota bacterium]|nr:MAG: preprotein translocase subunit SecY [Planctomycetota bacterium]